MSRNDETPYLRDRLKVHDLVRRFSGIARSLIETALLEEYLVCFQGGVELTMCTLLGFE